MRIWDVIKKSRYCIHSGVIVGDVVVFVFAVVKKLKYWLQLLEYQRQSYET